MKRLFAVVALAFLPLLAGCPSMPTTADLPASKVLPASGSEVLKGLVVAKETLDIAANFVADGVNQELIEPKQGRTWFEQLKTYRAKLADVEKLLAGGSFDAAQMQLAGTQALIKAVHDAAIEAVKRANRTKPTGLIEVRWQAEIQPWRLTWTY